MWLNDINKDNFRLYYIMIVIVNIYTIRLGRSFYNLLVRFRFILHYLVFRYIFLFNHFSHIL